MRKLINRQIETILSTGNLPRPSSIRELDNLRSMIGFNLPLAKAGLVPWTKQDIKMAEKFIEDYNKEKLRLQNTLRTTS